MSADIYNAAHGLFEALFGRQYGEKGLIPGSLESLNGISSNFDIF